ncbi:hypothetical protein LTR85_004360 [Meristemomyces frigidus]|nr:hypothetical protein LTR85_004360 [Meristemomyces frigidus]
MLRNVEIRLGTWNTLEHVEVYETRLPSTTGELSDFFKGSETLCTLAIGLDWTTTAGGGNLGILHLPLLDLKAAHDMVSETIEEESERLRNSLSSLAPSGQAYRISAGQYSTLRSELHTCRKRVLVFLSLAEAAVRANVYDPF